MIKVFIEIAILLLLVQQKVSKLIDNYPYSVYLWINSFPQATKIDLSHLALQDQLCEQVEKPFQLWISEDLELANIKNRNRTILILGGLIGGDLIGNTALFSLFDKVKSARIIFFPFANPTGFLFAHSNTYPTEVDVEKDFPLKKNQKQCLQSSALHILEYIFKTYEIDLSIYLHQGDPGVIYSWADQQYHKQIPQNSLHEWIALNLKKKFQEIEANFNSTQSSDFFSINKNRSDFVDWAYGASKYPEILSEVCGNKTVEKYPYFQMNGLAFSLAIGTEEQATKDKNKWEHKIITRGIQMTKWLISLVNPSIQIKIYRNYIFQAKLEGCRTAKILTIKILPQSLGDKLIVIDLQAIIPGSVGWVDLELLQVKDKIPEKGRLEIQFIADPFQIWQRQGETFFSSYRRYTFQHEYQTFQERTEIPINKKITDEEIKKKQVSQTKNKQRYFDSFRQSTSLDLPREHKEIEKQQTLNQIIGRQSIINIDNFTFWIIFYFIVGSLLIIIVWKIMKKKIQIKTEEHVETENNGSNQGFSEEMISLAIQND